MKLFESWVFLVQKIWTTRIFNFHVLQYPNIKVAGRAWRVGIVCTVLVACLKESDKDVARQPAVQNSFVA